MHEKLDIGEILANNDCIVYDEEAEMYYFEIPGCFRDMTVKDQEFRIRDQSFCDKDHLEFTAAERTAIPVLKLDDPEFFHCDRGTVLLSQKSKSLFLLRFLDAVGERVYNT